AIHQPFAASTNTKASTPTQNSGSIAAGVIISRRSCIGKSPRQVNHTAIYLIGGLGKISKAVTSGRAITQVESLTRAKTGPPAKSSNKSASREASAKPAATFISV